MKTIYWFLLSSFALNVIAADIPADPLQSPGWQTMAEAFLSEHEIQFDDRVQVLAPDSAEDSLNVPISVIADGFDEIKEIVVFSDLNPIAQILRFYPEKARPYIAFRIKVQQATPVRAAVLSGDGIWHVGGRWVDAMGGGCTLPSVGRTSGIWSDYLGNVSATVWDRPTEYDRMRILVMHPMDTGLAPGIPAFYLERLELVDQNNQLVASADLYEPISENPIFSFDIPNAIDDVITVSGIDNNGNRVHAQITNTAPSS